MFFPYFFQISVGLNCHKASVGRLATNEEKHNIVYPPLKIGHPGKSTAKGAWKSPVFWKGKASEPNLHEFKVPNANFQGYGIQKKWFREGKNNKPTNQRQHQQTSQPTNQTTNQSNQSIWIFFIIFLWNTISINQKINHPGFLPGPPGKPRHPTALRLHPFPLHNLDCPK